MKPGVHSNSNFNVHSFEYEKFVENITRLTKFIFVKFSVTHNLNNCKVNSSKTMCMFTQSIEQNNTMND